MRVIFAKFPIIKQDTNFIHQLLVTHYLSPPLSLACPKTYMQRFSSHFQLFFLIKNNFVTAFVRNKYTFQTGNDMEKINSILTRNKCSKWLETPCKEVSGLADSNGTRLEAVHSDVSELWTICLHYLGKCS